MAMTNAPVFPQTPNLYSADLLNATGTFAFAANSGTTTNLVALVTAGANGSLVEGINVTNSDATNPYVLQLLFLPSGGKLQLLASVNIPANSGFDGTHMPVQLLNTTNTPGLPVDANNNSYFYIPINGVLYVGTTAQIAANKQVTAVAIGGDF